MVDKCTKYTKDKLIDILIDGNKKMIIYMGQVASAIHSFNDSNLLHKRAIDINTEATRSLTTAVEVQTTAATSQQSLIKWILIVAISVISNSLSESNLT